MINRPQRLLTRGIQWDAEKRRNSKDSIKRNKRDDNEWNKRDDVKSNGTRRQWFVIETIEWKNCVPTKLYHQTSKAGADGIRQANRMNLGSTGYAGGGIYFAQTRNDTRSKAKNAGYSYDCLLRETREYQENRRSRLDDYLSLASNGRIWLRRDSSCHWSRVCWVRLRPSIHSKSEQAFLVGRKQTQDHTQ